MVHDEQRCTELEKLMSSSCGFDMSFIGLITRICLSSAEEYYVLWMLVEQGGDNEECPAKW